MTRLEQLQYKPTIAFKIQLSAQDGFSTRDVTTLKSITQFTSHTIIPRAVSSLPLRSLTQLLAFRWVAARGTVVYLTRCVQLERCVICCSVSLKETFEGKALERVYTSITMQMVNAAAHIRHIVTVWTVCLRPFGDSSWVFCMRVEYTVSQHNCCVSCFNALRFCHNMIFKDKRELKNFSLG